MFSSTLKLNSRTVFSSPSSSAPADSSSNSLDFSGYFKNESLSDVVLVVNEKRFSSHRLLLSVRSPVFKAMFGDSHWQEKKSSSTEKQEVKLMDIKSEKAFELILEYCYCGRICLLNKWTVDELLEALSLSHRFMLSELHVSLQYLFFSLLEEQVTLFNRSNSRPVSTTTSGSEDESGQNIKEQLEHIERETEVTTGKQLTVLSRLLDIDNSSVLYGALLLSSYTSFRILDLYEVFYEEADPSFEYLLLVLDRAETQING
eukprot:TRINITY_DN3048_c0_g1_i1.p1 TRINITY_DN3048_c0_g1~~TRINITY_DN3048_c0_g1_i1.p1  ORF type:complete len:260 (-),score=62.29 TRINITY_DN3048_c0_g1_i1:39-818(-)